MFERMCAAELLQGPVVLTFLIARDGLDLGFETEGCAAGRARAFSVCVPGYLNLCFVKNDEEGVSKASPRRGTRRCHSRMSACFGYLRGWDGDVAGEVRASACEGSEDELKVTRS
jgi:hypothetical protein